MQILFIAAYLAVISGKECDREIFHHCYNIIFAGILNFTHSSFHFKSPTGIPSLPFIMSGTQEMRSSLVRPPHIFDSVHINTFPNTLYPNYSLTKDFIAMMVIWEPSWDRMIWLHAGSYIQKEGLIY